MFFGPVIGLTIWFRSQPGHLQTGPGDAGCGE
jgi:hypothetical protein